MFRVAVLQVALMATLSFSASAATDSSNTWSMIEAARSAEGGWIRPSGFNVPGLGDPFAATQPFSLAWQKPGARSARTWQKRARPEVGGRGPNARADWFTYQRAYPGTQIPVGARQRALRQTDGIAEIAGRAKAGSNSAWTLMGPDGFDSRIEPTWGRMSGRVRALAIDPRDSNRLLLGTATGGAWLSADTGATWRPLTDNQPSLAVGAVAIDPNNSNVFYVGTGEANGTYYSAGILKSTDAGTTWRVLGAETFKRGAIAGIAVSPQDSNIVVVCAKPGKLFLGDNDIGVNVRGIYRSTNGGETFTATSNTACSGLAVVPANFNVMYHSATGGTANGLYKSTNGGVNWTLVTGAVNGDDVERLAIGVSPQGTRIFIGGKKGSDVAIQRSVDSGATWSEPLLTEIIENVEMADYRLYCESQCDYNNAIGVNPADVRDVFYGGVGIFRTPDSGATFTQVGSNNAGGGPLHVDHHLVMFDLNSAGVVYNGNDGGLYRSSDSGATWASIGGKLATIQPYHISLHPTNRNIIFTGNQDNGTTRRTDSNVWIEVGGGDGGYSAINYANPQIVYNSTTELSLGKSNNGGDTFAADITQVPKEMGEPTAFIAPVLMDPVNPEVIYGVTNRVWRSANGAQTWAAISPALTNTDTAFISNLAIARSDTSVIYTVASDGTVARSNPAGFVKINRAPLPGRYATSLAISPTDPNTVYVGFSGFNDTTPSTPGHVFKTINGGTNWTNVTTNLPDVPVNALAINPSQPNEVYAGTDTGVFITLNGGTSWAKMNNGLPNAGVAALAVNATTNVLAAATYGRSVWFAELNSTSTFALTVAKAGTGSGTVTSSPTGINCGATCSASYAAGTSVVLTASAASGSSFAGWSGDCTGTQSTCTVSVSQARNATATFNTQSAGTTVLQNGVAVTGLSGAQGSSLAFTIPIPAGARNLAVRTSGGTGDPDLLVRFGQAPTATTFDCLSEAVGTTEQCLFATPTTGTYHVLIRGFAAYSGLTLTASWQPAGGGNSAEPVAVVNLPLTTGTACAAFYSVKTFGNPGVVPGVTATEITLEGTDRRLVGGLIMKGNVLRSGVFAGVTVPPTPGRAVQLAPIAFWLPPDLGAATLEVVTGNTTLSSVRLPARSGAQVIPPILLGDRGGFFSVRLTPDTLAQFGDRPFAIELGVKFLDNTSAFFDSGTVVGGVIDGNNPTEVSFCMAISQNVKIRTLGFPTYGDGVTGQFFTIRNPQDVVVFDSRNP